MGEFNCMPKQAAGRGIAKKGRTFDVGEDRVFEKSTSSMLSQKLTGKRDVQHEPNFVCVPRSVRVGVVVGNGGSPPTLAHTHWAFLEQRSPCCSLQWSA